MRLVGIVGKKRNGKDTIGDYLVEHHGFQRYSFADPIKRGAMEMFGFTEQQMWGTAEDKETVDPRWGISPRKMLQLMGTELFQFDIHNHLEEGEFPVGRSVWVHRFKIWYEEQKDVKVCIPDVRFLHEEKVIVQLGGEIWRVERPNFGGGDLHASEMEQEKIIADDLFLNDGTLEDLFKKVEKKLAESKIIV